MRTVLKAIVVMILLFVESPAPRTLAADPVQKEPPPFEGAIELDPQTMREIADKIQPKVGESGLIAIESGGLRCAHFELDIDCSTTPRVYHGDFEIEDENGNKLFLKLKAEDEPATHR